MLYKNLKRVWSHNDMNYIPGFRETFPELNKVSNEELCDRWESLNIEFYTQKRKEVKFWVRLTLPFAMILFVLMFICLPGVYIITGNWSYKNTKNNRIFNWFRMLRLL